MTAAPAELIIRQPRASEYPICRMLLPELASDPNSRQIRLAFDSAGSVAGALTARDDGSGLSGLRLHVVHTMRRRGIGSQLIAYIVEQARRSGFKRLTATLDLKDEQDAEKFLVANGFERTSRLTIIEGPMEKVAPAWAALSEHTAKADPLPPGARFVGMDETPMDQLLELYAEHIAEIPVVPGLRRHWHLERYKETVSLLVDGKIVATVLAEIADGRLRVPGWIVLPEYRGKQIGALVRVTLHERLRGRWHEIRAIRFEYLDKAKATAKVSQEPGYDVVSILARFDRKID